MKNHDEQWEQVWRSAKEHPFYRGCAVILAGSTISLLLGFAFFILFQAVLFGFVWFGVYWPPAFRMLKQVFLPVSSYRDVDRVPMKWWQMITLPIKLAAVGYMLYVGGEILLNKGLLGQNLIYLIIK